MSKIAVAVCDSDTEYLNRFVTYLVERRSGEFEVHAYSVPERLLATLLEEKVDVVVCGSGFDGIVETVREQGIAVLILQETLPEMVADEGAYQPGEAVLCERVFRYQPVEAILHEVRVLAGSGAEPKPAEGMRTRMEVIGVCSPVCHEMQMPFALVVAQMMSEQRKVLYVNLMEHSGFLELFGMSVECNFGDIMLAIRRQGLSMDIFLKSVYEAEGVDYIPPFDNPEDLLEFTITDSEIFLNFLESQTDYDVLVLDFGAGIREFATMLSQCTSIYCLMRNGYFYDCRMNHFLKYLEREPGQEIAERLHVLNLPFSAKGIRGGIDVYRQLLWSEFGDYVRECLAGGAHEDIR